MMRNRNKSYKTDSGPEGKLVVKNKLVNVDYASKLILHRYQKQDSNSKLAVMVSKICIRNIDQNGIYYEQLYHSVSH